VTISLTPNKTMDSLPETLREATVLFNPHATMRYRVHKAREAIAANGGVADTSQEAVGKQLEKLYDAMIDVHKEYIESGVDEAYVSFVNQYNDENYVEENEEWRGADLYATLIDSYTQTGSSPPLTMLSRVLVKAVTVTGLVTFAPPNDKNKSYRLYADELKNYAFEK